MSADSVLVFQLGGNAAASATNCAVTFNPLSAAMASVIATEMRVTLLQVVNSTGLCPSPTVLQLYKTAPIASLQATQPAGSGSSVFSPSLTFSTEGDDASFPIYATFNPNCRLQVLLLLNRQGDIKKWYVWIPTTVYTSVVTALVIPLFFFQTTIPPGLCGLLIFLIFLGFFGSCIGLVMELLLWQSSLGRMFPLPPSVTLYCCLPILYMLYMFSLLFRASNSGTLIFMAMLRLFVYGINCALCVGYWVAGYVVLGSLSIAQFFVTNAILTGYFAYVSVRFNQSPVGRIAIGQSFALLWCVPVTPFACCALAFYDLYALSRGEAYREGGLRIRDVVRVYNLQMSIPLFFFQNVCGIALLATATAYHMPLVVLLFPSLFLWGLHTIYVIDQYMRECRRWRQRGIGTGRGCYAWYLSLSAVMDYLLQGEGASAAAYKASVTQQHPPSTAEQQAFLNELAQAEVASTMRSRSRSAGRFNGNKAYPDNYVSGSPNLNNHVELYRDGAVLGVDGEEVIPFPPLPERGSHHASVDPSLYQGFSPPTRQPPSSSSDEDQDLDSSSTSSRKRVEYWPNSIER
ncbi:hypothetical protein STCU_08914 [Strigomonas culicis]|uniref:Transmembrane protein n=1 Tax=Strigomonas culicis TaxID=28005 RepID=S9V181_9TRYP|nr:hypothetical protein STCU_08914 [Strigomonas culicis]|eukprot:EPY20616.1 hypothetical protein STCU_08914 [Strigomonas culicis]